MIAALWAAGALATEPTGSAVAPVDLRCRHAVGLAVGSYHGAVSWEDLGNRWSSTWSPTWGGVCARASSRGGGPWFGATMAPLLVQFRVVDGQPRHQWVHVVGGWNTPGDLSFGPFVAGGFAGFGGGVDARAELGPGALDLRVGAFGPTHASVNVQVAWQWVATRERR